MKSTFNDLSINEQINFVNQQLNNDSSISVTKLCKKFGLNKNTVVSRFTKGGFKYDSSKRKYIKDDTLVIQDNVGIKEVSLPDENSNKNSTNEDLEELLKYKDDIIKLVMEHKNSDLVCKKDMIIDNNIVGGKTTNHNFKIYTNVKNEIQELQKQYPQFRLLDLVSTALHEYCYKYLKE
ncbi:hypothetical protein [Clostridium botulinum]|uniref:hypothetical protein n=1 Tax=Clostridium botulinum TaxID=1491 RepID=UPI0006A542DF|nr:hypothetical protein [Clostridium botulinum]KOC49520.1 hypothetical protein ADU88_05630 [Clostridium botulinum]